MENARENMRYIAEKCFEANRSVSEDIEGK